MRVPVRLAKFLSLTAAAVAGSLCCADPAWAGSSGEDQPNLQQALNGICAAIGISPCPQLPTATQIILEMSGLMNSPPDDVRNVNFAVPCGNLYFGGPPCTTVAVNAVNAPVKSPQENPLAISYLTPLAFKSQASVTQYGDPAAKRFLYAAVIEGADGQPQVLEIVLDDTLATNKHFSKGPVINFSLPLVVLKNGIETPVAATLKLTATCNGEQDCLSGSVSGIPGTTKSPSAAQIGIQFASSFESSPNSKTPHRTYELLIPLVATVQNDGGYFAIPLTPPPCANGHGANPLSGYCNAFSTEKLGFPAPAVLGPGASIGFAPYAAPLCTAVTCPDSLPNPPPTRYFGFCASFANVPAIATFIQIGTDGTASLSSPVSAQGIQCPTQN